MTKSNCLIFSCALYTRRRRKGKRCGFRIRKSRTGFWPHFIFKEARPHSRSHREVSYVPHLGRRKELPYVVFRGWIKWGDRVIEGALE